MRKGQLTLINGVMILLTLFAMFFISGIWYPILDTVLLPNFTQGSMEYNLSLLIFPLFMISLIVIIWLWSRPFM